MLYYRDTSRPYNSGMANALITFRVKTNLVNVESLKCKIEKKNLEQKAALVKPV